MKKKHLLLGGKGCGNAIVEAALTEYLHKHKRGRKEATRGNRRI